MLYLITDRQRTKAKLGYSCQPARRVRQLQTGSADELVLLATHPGDRSDEAKFHQWLSPQRKRGEWFAWCDKIETILQRWQSRQSIDLSS